MAEEEKTGDSVPEGQEVDSKIVTDAILEKTEEGTPTEKPEGETEEPKEGDQPKEVEEKAEKPEEKVEVKAPDEIEVQTQKLFDKFKGDPKGLAKALANQYSLQGKQTGELGDLRKRNLEYDTLVKRIHDDPDGVKKDIDALHTTEEEKSSLLDRALGDPDVLPKYIESAVTEQLGRVEKERRTEEDLEKLYPDYKQTKAQRETLSEQIKAGRFTHQELLHLVVRGYWAPESLKDAKDLARAEDKDVLAKKLSEQPDKQKGGIEEKPEKTPSDVAQDEIVAASR